ncbi:Bromodomain containing protein [Aphelenchoides avenae]|nr:Bromodomain containing protein [Aphelenchus avenae]
MSDRFGKQEKLLSSKILLACFIVHQEAEPFLNEVSREHEDYYSVIKQPMCFRTIARRISYDVYQNPLEFIQDMNLVFQNCSKFNAPASEVANAGKSVYSLFVTAVAAHLPAYQRHVWIYVCLYQEKSAVDEEEYNPRTSRKKSPALKRVRKEIVN